MGGREGSAAPAVLTFLIADVRGYTRFTQEHGDEAAGRLAATFAELARETVTAGGGDLLELRGDEALCVFASARQALRTAVELQRAFRTRMDDGVGFMLPVGIGLDAGEAVPIEGGYRGGALNTAARLCSLAAPGEILASETVVSLARRLDGIRFVERRATKVKGLEKPLRVIEVVPEVPLPPLPDPAKSARRRVSRRGLVLAAAAAAVCVAAAGLLLAHGGGAGGLTALDADALGTIDAKAGEIASQVRLTGPPSAAAAGGNALWIASRAAETVTRFDPATRSMRTLALPGPPGGVAYGHGSLWVTDARNRALLQINPRTSAQVQPISVGNLPGAIAVGYGAVWVVNEVDGTVSRFDLDRGAVTKTVPVGPGPAGIAAGLNGIWVASERSGTVLRLDPRSGDVVQPIPVGNGPTGVAVGSGSVWVANTRDGTVSQIDPSRNAVRATIPVGTSPSAVAAGDGAVWVADGDSGTVTRIDPVAGADSKRLIVGSRPTALALEGGKVYAATDIPLSGHRGGVLRVETWLPGCRSNPEPACADLGLWSLVWDGLVAYRRVGGEAGSTLVPDLAARLPTSADGKTYTFQLRRGIRYSDGTPVRASDFRPSVERVIDVGGSWGSFADVVGADKCTPGKACDLSEGITADDRAGTITIRLARADTDFLYGLALPDASFVPARAARGRLGSHPIPGTGPYRVAFFARSEIRLVRNPRFHVWSREARPDGYPAEIRFLLSEDAESRVRAVERGAADWVSLSIPFLTAARQRGLITRYADRYHASDSAATHFLFLNTRVPPFDDVRARRAVNYAVDRAKLALLAGGPTRMRPTCQILPPSIPGYRPYCPYTAHPSRAGTWSAPDLAKARKLVAASGTTGDLVTVLVPKAAIASALGKYFTRLLRQLGYHAKLREVDWPIHVSLMADSRNRIQTGTIGWLADKLTPSNFVQPLFTCAAFTPKSPRNSNLSEYCNPRLDAAARAAVAAQASDPVRAATLWAAIDKTLADQAVGVPWANARDTALVSARVGNYQTHPLWGTLFDQLWVKTSSSS